MVVREMIGLRDVRLFAQERCSKFIAEIQSSPYI